MNIQRNLAALLLMGSFTTGLMAMDFADTQSMSLKTTQVNHVDNRAALTSRIESEIDCVYAQLINSQEESTAYFANAQFNEAHSQVLQQRIDQLQSQHEKHTSLFEIIYKDDFWELFENGSYFYEQSQQNINLLPLFHEATQTYFKFQQNNAIKAWKESLTVDDQIVELLSVLDLSRPIGIVIGACPSEASHFTNVDGVQLIYVDANLGGYISVSNAFHGATVEDLVSPFFIHAGIANATFLQTLLSSRLSGAVDFITADADVCHWFHLNHDHINSLLSLIKENGKIVFDYNTNSSSVKGGQYNLQIMQNDLLTYLTREDDGLLQHLILLPINFIENQEVQYFNEYKSIYEQYLHQYNGYKLDGFIKVKESQFHPFWNPSHAKLPVGCPFYLEITKNKHISSSR